GKFKKEYEYSQNNRSLSSEEATALLDINDQELEIVLMSSISYLNGMTQKQKVSLQTKVIADASFLPNEKYLYIGKDGMNGMYSKEKVDRIISVFSVTSEDLAAHVNTSNAQYLEDYYACSGWGGVGRSLIQTYKIRLESGKLIIPFVKISGDLTGIEDFNSYLKADKSVQNPLSPVAEGYEAVFEKNSEGRYVWKQTVKTGLPISIDE
ncbi:MAG: hypothetical protein HUJ54_14975, partial [Erysipelotrichaceae bacterium]|nr:hypothetical protein [Erysipelotrichaceae bacterium]